jgi:hypothetical protein
MAEMKEFDIKCEKCGPVQLKTEDWHVDGDGVMHYRGRCPKCGGVSLGSQVPPPLQKIIEGAQQELAIAEKRVGQIKTMQANLQHMAGTPDDVVASLNTELEFANAKVAGLNEDIKRLGELQKRFAQVEAKAATPKAESARR